MVESGFDPGPERAAWLALLDELEASLGEASLGANTSAPSIAPGTTAQPWAPPSGLGPIPPDLADRARDILGGQREVIAELLADRRTVGEQLAALRQVPAPATQAVYLDITG